jgi:hypothetical protein
MVKNSPIPAKVRTNFDLLWVFDTHQNEGTGKIGISSPVVADIDKDGELEVIIGDTEGTVWCISAGGTASRGQQDWTMFHYDVNNSGFYDPRVSYAVNVKPARDPSTKPDQYGMEIYLKR